MYKFEIDLLRWVWNVYFTEDGKDDFICSFQDIESAQDYCDMQNGALVSVMVVG